MIELAFPVLEKIAESPNVPHAISPLSEKNRSEGSRRLKKHQNDESPELSGICWKKMRFILSSQS